MTQKHTKRLEMVKKLLKHHGEMNVQQLHSFMVKTDPHLNYFALRQWMARYRKKHPGTIRICRFTNNNGGQPTPVFCLGSEPDAEFDPLARRIMWLRKRLQEKLIKQGRATAPAPAASIWSGLGAR